MPKIATVTGHMPTATAAEHWSAVATAWDDNVDEVELLKQSATEALIEGLRIEVGERVVELGAGAGTLGATWSRLVGPTGTVVVSDIAPGMVDAARRRCSGLANVEVNVVDMTAIELPTASVDVVASRMGLMFAPEPAVAVEEMRRVLRPGGRIGALTWAGAELNPWMTCVGMAAMLNGVVAGGPPVGPGGIFSLGDPTRLVAIAGGAGFVDATVQEIDVSFFAVSIDEHMRRVSSLAGPLAAAFAAATADQLAAVRNTATDLAARYTRDDGLHLPGKALLLTARV